MTQMLLPVFTEEIKLINSLIGYVKENNYVYYFNGKMRRYDWNLTDTL